MFWTRAFASYSKGAESVPIYVEAWRMTYWGAPCYGIASLTFGQDVRFTQFLVYVAIGFPISFGLCWLFRRLGLRARQTLASKTATTN